MKRIRSGAVAAVLVAALGTGAAPVCAAGPVQMADVTIPASDGANLVGDVYLPGDGKGRYPAVVDMEPYGRSSSTEFVPGGYARVNTDVRGSGKSGGALCLLCDREQQDVYDVVEWIAKQPWSDGRVALYGYSYSAITALLGAEKQPPHLKAVVVGHPPTDPYRDVVWHNGLFDLGFVYQWFAGQTATQALGLGNQPQVLDRLQQEFAVQTRQVPLYGPLYEERSAMARVSRIKVPVYIFTGWEDMYSRGDLWFIDALKSKDNMLWIDASTHHGTADLGEIGAPYSDSAADRLKNLAALGAEAPAGEPQKWLDRFVKGVRNGIDKLPRVRYFDKGDRKWRSAPSWRSVQTRTVSRFLSEARSGSARLSQNDGTLAEEVPRGRASYQQMYLYNPLAGITIPAGKDGPDGFLPFIPLDQGIDQATGLTYSTPVLKEALPLAGPSELKFWAITEAPDMAWVARLIDVAPNGTSSVITQGWLKASFRAVDEKRSRPGAPYLPDDHVLPVTIGLPTEYRIDIWDTAYTLAPGHRLRVWLSSADTPTHEPLLVAGRNIVMHDAAHPSQLILNTRLPVTPTKPVKKKPGKPKKKKPARK